jgi:hypothetical protein
LFNSRGKEIEKLKKQYKNLENELEKRVASAEAAEAAANATAKSIATGEKDRKDETTGEKDRKDETTGEKDRKDETTGEKDRKDETTGEKDRKDKDEEIRKFKEEMKSIIDLFSAYGNHGISAILDLMTITIDPDTRIFAYRKIEQMKKPKRI